MSEAQMTDTRIETVSPGMVSLRADLGAEALGQVGITVPAPLTAAECDAGTVLWFSPDELLILTSDAPALVARIDAAMGDAHHLALDVSSARAVFRITGTEAGVRETLGKLCPADLSPAAAPKGTVRRSRLAQIAAAIWMGEGEAHVLMFRSVATYAEELLRGAARTPVGVY